MAGFARWFGGSFIVVCYEAHLSSFPPNYADPLSGRPANQGRRKTLDRYDVLRQAEIISKVVM